MEALLTFSGALQISQNRGLFSFCETVVTHSLSSYSSYDFHCLWLRHCSINAYIFWGQENKYDIQIHVIHPKYIDLQFIRFVYWGVDKSQLDWFCYEQSKGPTHKKCILRLNLDQKINFSFYFNFLLYFWHFNLCALICFLTPYQR